MGENRDVLDRNAPAPDLTLAYGPLADHVADIWLPSRETRTQLAPLFILWHGGFWRSSFDRHHLGPMAADLATRGYVVATPEYRRTGNGGGWPTTFLDIAATADMLPAAIAKAVPGLIDPARVVYAGHSAGGHLAVWAALRDRLPADAPGRIDRLPPISGILALAPVLDLRAAYRLDLDEGAVAALLGGSPDDVEDRYAATDPSLLGAAEATLTIVHGDRDARVPIAISRDYCAAMGGSLIEIPDGEHFAVIDPLADAWDAVVGALAELAGTPE